MSDADEATEAEICNGSAGGEGRKGGEEEGGGGPHARFSFVHYLSGAAAADGFAFRHNRCFPTHRVCRVLLSIGAYYRIKSKCFSVY